MADLNETRLIGRLTRDVDLRSTASGSYVASFGLATGRKFKGADGVLKDETTFVDITCFGKLAETCSKYLAKGRQVFIGGRLKLEQWQDKQTGQNRSKLAVIAENVQFLDYGDRQQRQEQPAQNYQQQNFVPAAAPQEWKPPQTTDPGFEPDEPPF